MVYMSRTVMRRGCWADALRVFPYGLHISTSCFVFFLSRIILTLDNPDRTTQTVLDSGLIWSSVGNQRCSSWGPKTVVVTHRVISDTTSDCTSGEGRPVQWPERHPRLFPAPRHHTGGREKGCVTRGPPFGPAQPRRPPWTPACLTPSDCTTPRTH